MTTLDEAKRFARERWRVGFEAPAPASAETVQRVQKVVDAAVKAAHERFARSVAARVAADAPRPTWTGPETTGDDLKKRDAKGLDAAREHGRHVGEALVKAADVARERAALSGGRRIAAGAIVDSYAERDRLRALSKADGWVSDARLKESGQLAEALVEPIPRAAFVPQPASRPPVAAAEDRLVAAGAGAAALAGGTPEEIMAAIADGSPAWLERITSRSGVEAIRHARRLPVGAVGRAGPA